MLEIGPIENYLHPEMLKSFRHLIEDHENFLLTTHVHPDGDALGSELSLFYFLATLGKQATIFNHSPVPELYRFLDPQHIIQTYKSRNHRSLLPGFDVCFVLDIGDWDRLRTIGEDLKKLRHRSRRKPFVVCIDHHPPENKIGDLDIIYPQASSTGEILFLMMSSFNFSLDRAIAEALYTAIVTDTGSFRFTNTTVNSHIISAYLLHQGVDHKAIYQKVYENEPLSKIRLLTELLENLNFECDHQVVWYTISREMLQRYHLEPHEVEGVSDFPRRIRGVQISILFMEVDQTRTKVSFRSTGNIPINGFAQSFGGGGHPYASGALVKKPLQITVQEVIGKVCQFYRENHPSF